MNTPGLYTETVEAATEGLRPGRPLKWWQRALLGILNSQLFFLAFMAGAGAVLGALLWLLLLPFGSGGPFGEFVGKNALVWLVLSALGVGGTRR